MTRTPLHSIAAIGSAMLMLLFVSARAVQADPLLITSGTITLNSDGLSAFDLHGNGFAIGGSFTGDSFPPSGGAEGTTIQVGGHYGGTSVPGGNTAVINGVDYGQIFTASSFTVSAALPLPSGASEGILETFLFPFSLTGSVQGFPSAGSQTQLFNVNLMGAGTARLGPLRNVGGTWLNQGSLILKFEQQPSVPTPEPATLLLMSGGLAACLRAARRRASKRSIVQPEEVR